MAAGERLGVFGGTFDPVHVGHLVAATNARHALALDEVLLVVANQPWQKHDRDVTPAEHRLAMVTAAVEGHEGLEPCGIEVDRGGDSYTADTLEALARPSRELYLIVGADLVAELPSWLRIDAVRELATLVVVNRPGAPDVDPGPGWRTERVDIPALDVSASDLRARAAAGLPIDWLVPDPVIAVIDRLGLYAVGR